LTAASIVQALNARFAGIQEAFVAIFRAAGAGLGTVGGFKLDVEDRAAWASKSCIRRSREQ